MNLRPTGFLPDEEALQTDVYIESLLARHARAPVGLESSGGSEAEIGHAARLLERTLVRFHPSFRFEEALARRLRESAGPGGLRGGAEAGTERGSIGQLVPLPHGPGLVAAADGRARGLLVGGAIASGVSLAGAALLAWRRSRRGLD